MRFWGHWSWRLIWTKPRNINDMTSLLGVKNRCDLHYLYRMTDIALLSCYSGLTVNGIKSKLSVITSWMIQLTSCESWSQNSKPFSLFPSCSSTSLLKWNIPWNLCLQEIGDLLEFRQRLVDHNMEYECIAIFVIWSFTWIGVFLVHCSQRPQNELSCWNELFKFTSVIFSKVLSVGKHC